MPVLDASSVAALLAEYGQRAALRGGNPYRARAYARAAENLMALAMPLEDVIATGQLRDIPGVGEAIADIITTLHLTGTHPSLESMRRETPGSVLEMLGLQQNLERARALGTSLQSSEPPVGGGLR
jgi:DNA polymerase (family X)